MNFLGYELNYNLGVTRDIKKAFGKDYMEVIQTTPDVDHIIKFLYNTLDKDVRNQVRFNEFAEEVYNSEYGLMKLIDIYNDITIKIMYPDLSLEEGKEMAQRKVESQST